MIIRPVGPNLFDLTGIPGAPVGEAVRGVTPFILLPLAHFPEMSLWLPTLAYG